MFKNIKSKITAGAIALTAGAPVFAEGIDTTTLINGITGLVVTVTAVGGALLTVYVTVKGFKLIRSSLAG